MHCLLILMLIVHLVDGKLNLSAICKFKGLEELHSRLNDKTLNIPPKMKKSDVCHAISDSWYFKEKGLKMVSEPAVFEAGICSCLKWICGGEDSIEDKSAENIEVYNDIVGNNIVENVFECFAKPTTRTITKNNGTKYYISKEYNVSDMSGQHIAGYFIFKEEGGKFHYEALAEEPALLVDGSVEKQYLDLRGNHQPSNEKFEDPLCKLDVQKQLRICSIVMNTPYIGKEFNFRPSTDYVYNGCALREITFRTSFGISRTKGMTYKEYMIMCHVKKFPESAFIYLSRAYESQKVFVYRAHDIKMYLDSLTTNVREVIDNV